MALARFIERAESIIVARCYAPTPCFCGSCCVALQLHPVAAPDGLFTALRRFRRVTGFTSRSARKEADETRRDRQRILAMGCTRFPRPADAGGPGQSGRTGPAAADTEPCRRRP